MNTSTTKFNDQIIYYKYVKLWNNVVNNVLLNTCFRRIIYRIYYFSIILFSVRRNMTSLIFYLFYFDIHDVPGCGKYYAVATTLYLP